MIEHPARAMRTATLLALACLADSASAAEAGATPAAVSAGDPPLVIYHLEGRRSERIVWLCEELGRPYRLEYKRGNLAGSMQSIRDINPLMPVAPTVRYGDQIMVESGAIIELILAREGKGRLAPAVNSPDYPYYLQWMHFSEGSLAARVIADYRVALIQGRPKQPDGGYRLVDSEDVIRFADDFLSKHAWFGGKEFSAADIMMVFPINFAGGLNVVDMSKFPHVVAWQKKIENRPAYKKMLTVARPDGLIGSPRALPKETTAQ